VWDNLRKAISLERQQLRRLLQDYRPLLEKCAAAPPNLTELSALALVLHSFYNGVENIFRRVATELGSGAPRGQFWHRRLLDSMKQPATARPALISEQLAERLDEYLQFRHLFRHSYGFDLGWNSMKPLALECQDTLKQLEWELDRFLETADPGDREAAG